MPRLCLISPGHLATNPRLVKEANALAEAGYAVSVVSGRYLPWAMQQDKQLLHEHCRWRAALAFGPHAPLPVRIRQALTQKPARRLIQMGFRQQRLSELAWHPLVPDLQAAALAIPADLYIAHYPAALPAAASAAAMYGTHYAFDAEDFHHGDYPDEARYETERQLLSRIESRYLPGCRVITASSSGIAAAYAELYGLARPLVIRNVFPRAQAPTGPTAAGTAEPSPSLYWFSQTIGPDRGLECAVQALPLARCCPHLHLRGFLNSSYRQQLLRLAHGLGVGRQLHFHPPAPPAHMERLAAAYDVGLVGECAPTRNREIALTNKVFSYALAGLPILLSDIPAHRRLAPEAGEAVRLFRRQDPRSLADALDGWLCGSREVLAAARAAAYRLGQERWNWEREQRVWLARIAAVLQEETKTTLPPSL